MTSTTSSTASPLIQLFHNQLFDELEAHRLKNLGQEGQVDGDVQREDLGQASNRIVAQAHFLFPENK